jgi:hypothetical protein
MRTSTETKPESASERLEAGIAALEAAQEITLHLAIGAESNRKRQELSHLAARLCEAVKSLKSIFCFGKDEIPF